MTDDTMHKKLQHETHVNEQRDKKNLTAHKRR